MVYHRGWGRCSWYWFFLFCYFFLFLFCFNSFIFWNERMERSSKFYEWFVFLVSYYLWYRFQLFNWLSDTYWTYSQMFYQTMQTIPSGNLHRGKKEIYGYWQWIHIDPLGKHARLLQKTPVICCEFRIMIIFEVSLWFWNLIDYVL